MKTVTVVVVEICAPYNVKIERNDLMGFVEIKEGELIPLTDDMATIKENIPRHPRTSLSWDEIAKQCKLQVPDKFRKRYNNILFKHQKAISLGKYDLVWPEITSTRST
jgi:hypothetical protein